MIVEILLLLKGEVPALLLKMTKGIPGLFLEGLMPLHGALMHIPGELVVSVYRLLLLEMLHPVDRVTARRGIGSAVADAAMLTGAGVRARGPAAAAFDGSYNGREENQHTDADEDIDDYHNHNFP